MSFIALILLVLASFLTAQSAVDLDIHQHHHGGGNHHCCPACHAGYLPVLESTNVASVSDPDLRGWRHDPLDVFVLSSNREHHDSSRAPPV